MTKAQKENQARFKKVQAEAKKLKAKNPKLKHIDAVKKAWAIVSPGSAKKKAPVKKVSALKKKAPIKKIGVVSVGPINYTALKRTYDKNEDRNLHTENIVFLAYKLGSKADQLLAQKLYADLEKYGYSRQSNQKKQNALSRKLYARLIVGYKKENQIGLVKKKAPVKKKAQVDRHKDTASHNVKISVMSGNRTLADRKMYTDFAKKELFKDYEKLLDKIFRFEKYVRDYTILEKDKGYNLDNRKSFAKENKIYKKYLVELKTQAKILKNIL